MAEIVEILESRAGVSKAGKPYQVTKVKLDDGKEAETLDTVQVGMIGEAIYDDQYKKFNFKKQNLTGGRPTGGVKEFKADPVKQASIEKQVVLKASLDAVEKLVTLGIVEIKTTEEFNQQWWNEYAFANKLLNTNPDHKVETKETPSPKVSEEGDTPGVSRAKEILEIEDDIDLDGIDFGDEA